MMNITQQSKVGESQTRMGVNVVQHRTLMILEVKLRTLQSKQDKLRCDEMEANVRTVGSCSRSTADGESHIRNFKF